MKKFFESKTKEGKVSEIAAKLACSIRELHFKYGKLNPHSLNNLYRVGAFGNSIHAFALFLGNRLVEAIEKEDKVVANFNITESDNSSKISVGVLSASEYEWDELFYGYDEMKGNGICFHFVFNGDLEHSLHWLYLEAA